MLGPYLEVLEDRTRSLTDIDQVLGAREFRPVFTSSVNLGMADSAWWFRFTVRLDPGQVWYFDPDWAYVRTLDFYSPLPGSVSDERRWARTSHRFGSTTEGRLIPIIADGQSHTYYFRVFSERVSFVRPSLCERNRCLSENNLRSAAFGAFVAVLMAMVVYNFVIFIYLRDRSYLWFVVFHAALLGYFSNKMWTPFFSYELQPLVAATSINLCAVSMCLFLRDFLETRKFHPIWDKMLLGMLLPTGALIVLGPLLPSAHIHTMFNLSFNVIVFMMGFGVSLSSCFKGHWPGCILFIAWCLVSMLFFVFSATVVGWSSLGYSMGFNLALAGEAVLMSLPLAYRIRQLKLEREASAMATQTKNLFLARISHEIRTPMTAIMGFTDIALQKVSCDQVRQCLLKVKIAAGHLLGLMNEMLDLAKIEAGKLEVERKPFDLASLLREACDIVAPMVQKNGNELLCNLEEGMPVHLIGDPMRLKQVLVNLAGNAAKFTSGGEVRISVNRSKMQKGEVAPAEGRVKLHFEVADTGPGIPRELLPRLFSPFEQGGGDTANRYGGAGLGLNISSRLVDLMGGRIGLSSEPGRGSVFWFILEFDLQDQPHSPELMVPSAMQGKSILVADDHPAALQALSGALARLGFVCVTVESGQQALEAVTSEPGRFVLITLDWDMPELDGPETLSCLRAQGLSGNVPVLLSALSSHVDPQGRDLAEIGAAGLLVKPVTHAGVLRTVLTALGCEADRSVQESGKEQNLSLRQAIRGLRVLLVDDNVFNQEVTCIILEEIEAVTEVANNGLEALQRLEEAREPYDAVLMDMSMPVMDGLEASRRIRSIGRFRELPIIAMTANAMKGDRETCLAAGMNDHLAKPIDTRELFDALERWVLRGEILASR
ncbi:His Kinase A (phospho-acceptor) domain-containing protein, partial [Desulfomicrobium norvegicum]